MHVKVVAYKTPSYSKQIFILSNSTYDIVDKYTFPNKSIY
jgi:hypothetical protein